jgi:hypothetical protein
MFFYFIFKQRSLPWTTKLGKHMLQQNEKFIEGYVLSAVSLYEIKVIVPFMVLLKVE